MLPRRVYKKPTEEELLKKLNDYKERSRRREQGLKVEGDEEEVDVKNVTGRLMDKSPIVKHKGGHDQTWYFRWLIDISKLSHRADYIIQRLRS